MGREGALIRALHMTRSSAMTHREKPSESRQLVDRSIVDACLNAGRAQRGFHPVPFFAVRKDNRVDMMRGCPFRGDRVKRKNQLPQVRMESVVVSDNQIPPATVDIVQLPQLCQANRGADVVEAEIETHFHNVVTRWASTALVPAGSRHAVTAKEPRSSGQFGVVGRDDATFPRGDVLVSKETEAAGHSQTARGSSPILGARRVGGILNEGEVLVFGE